ncbi:MAG: hypothetical protein DI630_25540 [Gordonia sp. (in: high G+C Gram-positive bacteria)]|nr:MAG: hypothetical protein DI630_25540 [Gordonia sp. (in: high G+C Gram-positive bacteria)]
MQRRYVQAPLGVPHLARHQGRPHLAGYARPGAAGTRPDGDEGPRPRSPTAVRPLPQISNHQTQVRLRRQSLCPTTTNRTSQLS